MALKKQLKEVKAKIVYWQQYPATNWFSKMYKSHQRKKYEHEKADIEYKLNKTKML
jgi:hypothetical protein